MKKLPLLPDLRSPYPYPQLMISSKSLDKNISAIKNLTSNKCKILIPVKANAYGCGLAPIIEYIQQTNIDHIGVANLNEALRARELGYQKEILLLGSFYKEHVSLIEKAQATCSITDLWQIRFLQKLALTKKAPFKVHIKLDLGMGRIGIMPHQIKDLIHQLNASQLSKSNFSAIKICGIYTHFPCADETTNATKARSTLEHIASFEKYSKQIIKKLKLKRKDILLHSANSHAIMNYPQSHFDMVRPGLMFYGYYQDMKEKHKQKSRVALSPSLRLVARPISERVLKRNMQISYGSMFQVRKKNKRVLVIPVGYADGISRCISNKVKFDRSRLLGRVTMDQVIIEAQKKQTLNSQIEVIGSNSTSLEKWAKYSNTVTYEILTSLGLRLNRTLVDE